MISTPIPAERPEETLRRAADKLSENARRPFAWNHRAMDGLAAAFKHAAEHHPTTLETPECPSCDGGRCEHGWFYWCEFCGEPLIDCSCWYGRLLAVAYAVLGMDDIAAQAAARAKDTEAAAVQANGTGG